MLALTFYCFLRNFFKNTGLRINGIIRSQVTARIKAAFVLLGKYCKVERVSMIQ